VYARREDFSVVVFSLSSHRGEIKDRKRNETKQVRVF
jgi:hypothetical protein